MDKHLIYANNFLCIYPNIKSLSKRPLVLFSILELNKN
jgi:hypothetical protein